MSDLYNFLNRLNGAYLIVGKHNCNHGGLVGNKRAKLIEINHTVLVNTAIANLKALFCKCLAGMKNCVMLDLAGDDVISALRLHSHSRAADSPVVRLGTTRCEINFISITAENVSNSRSCIIKNILCADTHGMRAGGVTPLALKARQHRIYNLAADRSCSRVICIYESTQNIFFPFQLFKIFLP